MAIYILEDDPIQSRFMQEFIENYMEQEGVQSQLSVFSRAKDLLEGVNYTQKNLYLLDLQLKSDLTAGLDVAEELRRRDSQGEIVFVTSHEELALQAYQTMVSALMFIHKNVESQVFANQFNEVLYHYFQQETDLDNPILLFKSKHAYIREKLSDILYFEVTGNHQISLITKYKQISFYGTLKEIQELNKNLIRVHQSFLVNELAIKSLDKSNKILELINGDSIPVTRTYWERVKNIFER